MMADTGRRPHFEADQARQRTLEAEDSYIQALEQYKLQLDLFKLTLAIPTDAYIKLDPNELFALEQSGMTDLDFEVGQAVASALDFRLDLSNFRDQVQDAQRKVDVAADNLAAELNLIGSARVESKEKTNFTNLQFHRGDYGLGFEADLPLDRKAERNAYREALINVQRRQRDYQEETDRIKIQVRQAYRKLKEASVRYQIQLQSLKLAQTRVESTTMLLQEGRATTRDLLESRDSLLSAQNAKTKELVNHTISKLNFYRDMGILRVRPDGLWEEPDAGSVEYND